MAWFKGKNVMEGLTDFKDAFTKGKSSLMDTMKSRRGDALGFTPIGKNPMERAINKSKVLKQNPELNKKGIGLALPAIAAVGALGGAGMKALYNQTEGESGGYGSAAFLGGAAALGAVASRGKFMSKRLSRAGEKSIFAGALKDKTAGATAEWLGKAPKDGWRSSFVGERGLARATSDLVGASSGAISGTIAGGVYGAVSDDESILSGAFKGAGIGAVGGFMRGGGKRATTAYKTAKRNRDIASGMIYKEGGKLKNKAWEARKTATNTKQAQLLLNVGLSDRIGKTVVKTKNTRNAKGVLSTTSRTKKNRAVVSHENMIAANAPIRRREYLGQKKKQKKAIVGASRAMKREDNSFFNNNIKPTPGRIPVSEFIEHSMRSSSMTKKDVASSVMSMYNMGGKEANSLINQNIRFDKGRRG